MSAIGNCGARRPASDVSAGVGLVGLCTLLACIMIARAWPMIGEAIDLGAGRGRLSGPHAALMAMALSGLAMGLWSILVDKVHRRPSTGIDWARPRRIKEVLPISITKIAGLWASFALIAAGYFLGRWYWDGQYLFAMEVLAVAIIPMVMLSVPYVIWLDRVLIEARDHTWHFGAMVLGQGGWQAGEVWKHLRAWAIKGFFGAFMLSILPFGFASVVEADLGGIAGDPVRLGVFLFELLFVIDVQIGTVGYLLTLRPLDAHIRSGNPFLAGWVAALICYPPLVHAFMGDGGIIQYEYNTADWAYWLAGHEALLWLWAGWLVLLTAIYAWATFAFGIRFSNLTYRGVITHGPYRLTRHPAYLSKNAFWWFATMPFLVTSDSLADALRNTAFLALVSAIYYWRARTEEAHLLAEDEKYRAYHAFMADHGLITAPLVRLARALGRWCAGRQPRIGPADRPAAQPAE